MAYQNINQYNYPKLKLQVIYDGQDMSLASDEVDYNQEVVFSPFLIGLEDGKKLPVNLNLNSPLTTQNLNLVYGQYNYNNVIVSESFYDPKDVDFKCFSANTLCDIGLTGVDNGLVTRIKGDVLQYTNGFFNDSEKFDRLVYDRRMKFIQTTTNVPDNHKFSGVPLYTTYQMVSKTAPTIGRYVELYGGFYQGFYKLFGYDYNILPERMNKGWTVEMVLKPRFVDEYTPPSGYTTLNQIYPNNKNTFFYLGARAENKFYHYADGSPKCDTGYTRVTSGLTCEETCACCDYSVKNSRCIYVYPPRPKGGAYDPHLNYGCNLCQGNYQEKLTCGCGCNLDPCDTCGWMCFDHVCSGITVPSPTPTPTPSPTPPCDTYPTVVVCPPTKPCCTSCPNCGCDTCGCPPAEPSNTFQSVEDTCEKDPEWDALSNNLSFRLCGDPKNPGIGIRAIKITGGCETTGTCITGQTYTTGYTIVDICTPPIYPYCYQVNPAWLEEEHWFQVNVVWERYTYLDTCDLWWRGGLGDITKFYYLESLANNTVSLITVPYTSAYHPKKAEQIEQVQLNDTWAVEKKLREGRLRIYINGKIFHTIENFEELIPRGLNTDKERQVGVPFNISWGGGTQGLRENLTFSAITEPYGPYIQDPENFPINDLTGTTFNGLDNHILIEQNFAGTFEGAISQFRMYVEPLSAPEVKHNFKLLKDKFLMFNPDCPDCTTAICPTDDFTYNIEG
jgi:hypothetical protein